MAHKRRVNTTKYEIIRAASQAFLEHGYSATSIRSIAADLEMNAGLLMYHFPTKEHLLAVLVEMMCDFQWQMMKTAVEEGNSSLMAVCLELATMASMCEDDEIAKDFYLSAYSNPLTLGIIRKNDAQRAKLVFSEYCPDWEDKHFAEAEILVSGTEYTTFMTAGDEVSLEIRIAGALANIMMIYNVPEEIRKMKISKILAMDYHGLGKRILGEFRKFVEETNEHTFEELMT